MKVVTKLTGDQQHRPSVAWARQEYNCAVLHVIPVF